MICTLVEPEKPVTTSVNQITMDDNRLSTVRISNQNLLVVISEKGENFHCPIYHNAKPGRNDLFPWF